MERLNYSVNSYSPLSGAANEIMKDSIKDYESIKSYMISVSCSRGFSNFINETYTFKQHHLKQNDIVSMIMDHQ